MKPIISVLHRPWIILSLALLGTSPIVRLEAAAPRYPQSGINLEFIGQGLVVSPAEVYQYGYFTYVAGVENLFSGAPENESTALFTFFNELSTSRIGRYKLLQKIGEGGCGEVYMAEQEEPVRRLVALKVIKLGMDTRSVISRFEAERQALALMDHPNIAKVLDAGATETGRPYFVMELVRGVKITEYCDQARLSTRDRLELFIKVCQAIQHAHQKAVIHRDIKPSNVLVTLHDGVPVPKVIDFGIAKATQGKLTDHTLFTAFEQFLGTPAYMSPEQAEMSGLDIDTRSDLYSLGVLLYELLTGATPFDTKELLRAGVDEMRRIIREVEPMRPSTRLTQHVVASKSQTAIRKSQINSDLDWIVMKCLEKDRRRRYETANGLAADLRRHLTHEPVVARPPSAAYKLQKAWRRNKMVYSAAGLVAAALIVGLAVSLWQASVAFRARQQAEGSRLAEAQGRRAAQAAQAVAESERANAQLAADERLETLYAADIRAAYQAVQVNDFALATALIGKYRHYVPIDDSGPAEGLTEPVARPRDLLGFVPDGKKLLSASYDGSIKVWDPFESDLPTGLPNERSAVWFSPDARRLITEPTGGGGELDLWDTATRVKLGSVVPATAGADYAVSTVSEDGQLAALGTTDGVIDIWNLQTRQRGRRLEAGVDLSTHQLAFSPSGGWLAAAPTMLQHPYSAGGLSLWNLESGANSPIVFTLAFAPFAFCSDDRRMVLARKEGVVELFDFPGEVQLARWKAHAAPIHSLALSPDNRLLATGAEDALVRVWDIASQEKVLELKGHLTGIPAMAFAPDGKTLVTVTWDSTIKFWHLATGRELFTIDQFRMVRWSARFSPNGEYLAVNGNDRFGQRQLTLWRAPSWQEIIAAEP